MEFRSCINYLLTMAHREVHQKLCARLDQYDLTPAQYSVLNYLWEYERGTPKELAQVMMVENSTISGILDRMQKKELIDRRIDPEDRRSVQVVLTPAGQALKAEVVCAVEELNEVVLGSFTPEQRALLMSSLRTIARVE